MDFIGQNADERRKQEIEAAVKTISEITIRLHTIEVLQSKEILTQLLPAIILGEISAWGYGDLYMDLNAVVLATQKLAMEQAEWEEGEDHPNGLGCQWDDPSYNNPRSYEDFED